MAGNDDDDEDGDLHREHPLARITRDLAEHLHREIEAAGWLKESDPQEHPLNEVGMGTMMASAKLAGALTHFADLHAEGPPDPMIAGDALVRLKKARAALRDALAGLDAAEEQRLATPGWRSSARAAICPILARVEGLLGELRGYLR